MCSFPGLRIHLAPNGIQPHGQPRPNRGRLTLQHSVLQRRQSRHPGRAQRIGRHRFRRAGFNRRPQCLGLAPPSGRRAPEQRPLPFHLQTSFNLFDGSVQFGGHQGEPRGRAHLGQHRSGPSGKRSPSRCGRHQSVPFRRRAANGQRPFHARTFQAVRVHAAIVRPAQGHPPLQRHRSRIHGDRHPGQRQHLTPTVGPAFHAGHLHLVAHLLGHGHDGHQGQPAPEQRPEFNHGSRGRPHREQNARHPLRGVRCRGRHCSKWAHPPGR